jgi:hypothetical protein
MNIINRGIIKRMIKYDQIPGLSKTTSFAQKNF